MTSYFDTSGFVKEVERVPVSVSLATRAGLLAHEHGLRGYDSVHLASVDLVATDDLVFVAADATLCSAARSLGIAVARLAFR